MEENKSGSSKINTAVFVILFSIAVVFEFYWIMVYPDDYFMLFGIGIVALILGFLSVEGILSHYRRIQRERFEQNEMLIKTQKALYLATKKSAASAEIKAEQNLEAIKYLVTKISENQKELTELIASNKKNSNEDSVSDIGGIVEQITRSNAKLAQEIQTAITVNELVKTNADLVKNVKEVLGQTLSSSSSLASSLSQVQNDIKPVENINISTDTTKVFEDIENTLTETDISFETETENTSPEAPVSFDTETENIDFNELLPEVDSLDIEDADYIENIPSFDSFENCDNETTDDTAVTNNTEIPEQADAEEYTNTDENTDTVEEADTFEYADAMEDTGTSENIDIPEEADTPQDTDTSEDEVESAIDDALSKFMSFDDSSGNDDTPPDENVFNNVSDDDSSGNKMLSADEIAALFAKL